MAGYPVHQIKQKFKSGGEKKIDEGGEEGGGEVEKLTSRIYLASNGGRISFGASCPRYQGRRSGQKKKKKKRNKEGRLAQ